MRGDSPVSLAEYVIEIPTLLAGRILVLPLNTTLALFDEVRIGSGLLKEQYFPREGEFSSTPSSTST